MKKVMFSVLLMTVAFITFGQKGARLNFYGAYTFDDGFDVVSDANTYYNGTVKGGVQWGGGLEYLFNPQSSAEILYLHRSTKVPTNFKFGGTGPAPAPVEFDLKHDFIMLSGDGHFSQHGSKAEGYAGLMAGVLLSHLETPQGKSSSNENFAWGGRVGGNIWFTPKLGLKLQAMILSASRATGGDYYWSWYGPIYLTEYTTLWQFSLGGGLALKLGK